MTNAATGQIAPSRGLTTRCMTNITLTVRVEARRNREGHAAIQLTIMTSNATILWLRRATEVLRVIKLYVETFFELIRKILERRLAAVHVRMTNLAHRAGGSDELIQ